MYLDDSLTQDELDEANELIRIRTMPAIDRWEYYWAGGDEADMPSSDEFE